MFVNEAEVILRDEAAPGADKPGAGKGKDETVTMTRAERDSLVRERDEAIQSERYWSRSRAGNEKTAVVVEPDPEIETDDLVPAITGDATVDEAIFNDPDKWAEAISKGPAAIKSFVRSMGLVTGAEVAEIAAKVAQRTVNLEKSRMAGDNVILGEFPELKDDKSELFKATTAEVRKMVGLDPKAANSPATLYAAAQVAKLKLDAKTASTRRAPDGETDDERYDRVEREDERRSRSDAQDTSRTRGRSTADDTDMLGDQAKEVLRQMGGISEDEFRAERAKLGPARRRR